MKTRLRATVILQMDYVADSKNYNSNIVDDMIEMDKERFSNNPQECIQDMLENGKPEIIIQELP